MLARSAPGLVASVTADWMASIVVMTEEMAELAVSRIAWLWASAVLAEVTMPLSEVSCWPIAQ